MGEELRSASGTNDRPFLSCDAPRLLAAYEVVQRVPLREELEDPGGNIEVYCIRDKNAVPPQGEELLYVVHSERASEEARTRWLTGLTTVTSLSHPNIIRIFRVGIERESGRVFFTMSNEEQTNLRHRIDEWNRQGAALAPADAVALIRPIASALAMAHRKQAPHFGLRPERVWLAPDGTPRVAGFGLAPLLEASSPGQSEDVSPYAFPEDARGARTPQAVDLYSLGAILYELLTLRLPDTGDALIAPRHYNPQIPEELDEICLRCLDLTRKDRFLSLDALVAALGDFNAALTIPSDTPKVQRLGDTIDVRLPRSDDRLDSFGAYELIDPRPIGEGGMGKVYRVRNKNPILGGRIEALKVIRSRSASAEARQQFITEIAVMARLQHPNIVPVFDAGDEGGQLFFTMSFEEGGDLATWIERARKGRLEPGEHPLTTARAAEIVRDVARAIEMAHSHGIVHRDLKPANVLLSANGTPKVTDFGLAELMSPGQFSQLGSGSSCQGTPAYMSPEQARGEPLDERTDVYSLGAILYELLTKRPPFTSVRHGMKGVEEVLDAVKHRPVVPPREFDASIPPRLEAICLKCLSKKKEERYASATELVEALDDFLRPVHWKPRRRTVVAVAISAALLISSFWLWNVYRDQQNLQTKARTSVERASELEEGLHHQDAFSEYSLAEKTYDDLIDRPLLFLSRSQLVLDRSRIKLHMAFLSEEADDLDRAVREVHEVHHDLQALLDAPRLDRFIDRQWKHIDSPDHDFGPIWKDWNDLGYLLPSRSSHAADVLLLLAEAYHQDARYHLKKNELTRALKSYVASIILRRVLSDSDEQNFEYKRELAKAYGYIADTYREMNRLVTARQAYEDAERLRRGLAEATNNAKRLRDTCFHARDFGNWCRFHLWKGDLELAMQKAAEQVAYYEKHLSSIPVLPLEFLTERADAYVLAAELELDADMPSFDRAKKWLDRADSELRRMFQRHPDDQMTRLVRAKQARVELVRAKWALRKGNKDQASSRALAATEKLRESIPGRQNPWMHYYDLARGYALLAAATESPRRAGYYEGTAIDFLEKAVDAGFRNVGQLQLDRCLDGLPKTSEDWKRRIARPLGIAGPSTAGTRHADG